MKASSVIAFVIGGVAGFIGGSALAKKKYEEQAMREIDDTRKYYRDLIDDLMKEKQSKLDDISDQLEAAEEFIKINDIKKDPPIENDISEEDYFDYSKIANNRNETVVKSNVFENETGPYCITPKDFASKNNFDKITLNYVEKADKGPVFLDEYGDEFEDGYTAIGKENLDHFGEFETDVLYVRNEKFECDYEVFKDEKVLFEILEE